MIKKQYEEWPGPKGICYFNKFLDTTKSNDQANTLLKQYDASLAKSKRPTKINVKWRDPKKYMMFVMRWS